MGCRWGGSVDGGSTGYTVSRRLQNPHPHGDLTGNLDDVIRDPRTAILSVRAAHLSERATDTDDIIRESPRAGVGADEERMAGWPNFHHPSHVFL